MTSDIVEVTAELGNMNPLSPWPEMRNRLLAALPQAELLRLLPHLVPCPVASFEVLTAAGDAFNDAYFPETAVIGLLRRMRDGTLIETGTVGREGMTGLPIIVGNAPAIAAYTGVLPGICQRISGAALREALAECPVLEELLVRYAQVFINQIGQTVACNSLHSVEQRCARWLLTASEQIGVSTLPVTHDMLARMLGVRRSAVTTAALALQDAIAISYRRGKIRILDRPALEAISCECFALTRAYTERLLGARRFGDAGRADDDAPG